MDKTMSQGFLEKPVELIGSNIQYNIVKELVILPDEAPLSPCFFLFCFSFFCFQYFFPLCCYMMGKVSYAFFLYVVSSLNTIFDISVCYNARPET